MNFEKGKKWNYYWIVLETTPGINLLEHVMLDLWISNKQAFHMWMSNRGGWPVDNKTKESIYIFSRQLMKTESREILDSVMPQVCVEKVMNCYRRFSKNNNNKTPRGFYIFCFAYSLHLALNDVAKRYSDRTEFFISSKKLYNCSFYFSQMLKNIEHAFMGHKILNHCWIGDGKIE